MEYSRGKKGKLHGKDVVDLANGSSSANSSSSSDDDDDASSVEKSSGEY